MELKHLVKSLVVSIAVAEEEARKASDSYRCLCHYTELDVDEQTRFTSLIEPTIDDFVQNVVKQ